VILLSLTLVAWGEAVIFAEGRYDTVNLSIRPLVWFGGVRKPAEFQEVPVDH
jgi:hypothetical protein